MLASLPRKLVFLAMTKAGSTSIEAALAPHCEVRLSKAPGIKHMRYKRYERVVRPFLEKLDDGPFETVAVIRDPIEWLRSWHRYRARPALNGHPNSTAGMSFETFARRYLTEADPVIRKIGRPATFLEGSARKIGPDHLFRYERMDEVLRFLSDRFDREITLPKKNISPTDVPSPLPPQLRTELTAYFAPEYDIIASL